MVVYRFRYNVADIYTRDGRKYSRLAVLCVGYRYADNASLSLIEETEDASEK